MAMDNENKKLTWERFHAELRRRTAPKLKPLTDRSLNYDGRDPTAKIRARAKLQRLFFTKPAAADGISSTNEKSEVAIIVTPSHEGHHAGDGYSWHWGILVIDETLKCQWTVIEVLDGSPELSRPFPFSGAHGCPMVMILAGTQGLMRMRGDNWRWKERFPNTAVKNSLDCKKAVTHALKNPLAAYNPYYGRNYPTSASQTRQKSSFERNMQDAHACQVFQAAEDMLRLAMQREIQNPGVMQRKVLGYDFETGVKFGIELE